MSDQGEIKRVAVACEDHRGLDGEVSQHFGGSPSFIIVELDATGIRAAEVVPDPNAGEHRPGRLPRLVVDQGAKVIMAGSMGQRAQDVFRHHGVEVITGVRGNVRAALEAYLRGNTWEPISCGEGRHRHRRGCR